MNAKRRIAGIVVVALCGACGGDDGPLEEPVPMPDPTPIAYPVGLWDRKIEGETEVMIHVNAVGDVDSAMVSRGSGYPEFDSAAVAGARKLRFTPGKRGDRRVAMWTRVPIRFSQETATVGESRASGARNE